MNDTAQIERYLAGELSKEEMQAFELRLQTDEAFAENFALYQAIESEMRVDDDETALRDKLSSLTQKHLPSAGEAKIIPIGSYKKKWWIYAAAAAACIAVVLFWRPWQGDALSNEELYAQNAIPEQLPSTLRGNNDDSLLTRASELYNNKDYIAALPLLDSLVRNQPDEAQLQLSLDICLMQTGKFDSAIHKFDRLASGQSIYKFDALFWKALTLLKQDKIPACIEVLKQIPPEAGNYTKAQKLIKELE